MTTALTTEELDRLVGGAHHNPHGLLGTHEVPAETPPPAKKAPAKKAAAKDAGKDAAPAKKAPSPRKPKPRTVVRTLRPDAESAVLVMDGARHEMTRIHDGGVFETTVDGPATDYRVEVTYPGGNVWTVDDPYRWLPTLGDVDLHLIGEGRHENLWDVLGAHVRTYDTPGGQVSGTSFAVWAPNARGVRVTGEFDYWSGRGLPMRSLGSSGVWELFVPGVGDGAPYKFQILGADGVWRHKADPMAFATEVPPATASVVHTPSYEWRDDAWLAKRAQTSWHASPMSIYEVHLGSWRFGLSYRDLARELVDYVVETGFTHVEFLPVAEHPFGGSWGYQVSSYYAPSARFGNPDELRYLIDELHNAGIGVIVDWVPAHFPKDEFALGRFDGTPLYEHGDPRRGEQLDWGTYVFDFGRREVRNFLVANALFWLEQFHVDGLRVDAVASMLYLDYSRSEGGWEPNIHGGRENLEAVAFLQEMNATVYKRVPGVVTIAEESTSWPGVTRPTHLGGLGFGFKWDMGWMHDTLSYIAHEPIHRQWHHNELTFSMMYAYTENFVMPLSHDEVVHGKGSLLNKIPGDRWQQMATLRTLFAYMWAHPGKQLLFMGQEFGQSREWSEARSLDWELTDDPGHRGILRLITDLNHQYRDIDALWSRDTLESGFHWIDANDAAGNVYSFLRFGEDGSVLACIANFSSVPHERYRLGLPFTGRWDEIVNTDADVYFGSGVGNFGGVDAVDEMWHGQPASATLRVPPLGALWLRYRP
ncbi:1,4-alpha-glucan branching protein GlgB [Jatrophihabitans endophyticus]|uniref:1,4-alpha-glucan branching protein GlgB n=1 Tax=Jatrophihabitans endophyticus TaxID=1206085 RepID=UPI001A079A8F|nr:1,4-alpha-glucan branching protein GlgB [Jatrophihabitans endophyticus]MBE7189384.1 1,4-alpha-glucan branching protein GlgB [Jatrophihabitans endophyticus]